jgi:uncharacterized integral membrane protein
MKKAEMQWHYIIPAIVLSLLLLLLLVFNTNLLDKAQSAISNFLGILRMG